MLTLHPALPDHKIHGRIELSDRHPGYQQEFRDRRQRDLSGRGYLFRLGYASATVRTKGHISGPWPPGTRKACDHETGHRSAVLPDRVPVRAGGSAGPLFVLWAARPRSKLLRYPPHVHPVVECPPWP